MTKVTKVQVESEGGDETTNRRLSLVMVLRCQPPPKENKEDEEMLLISDNLIFGHMGYSDPLQKVTLTNPFHSSKSSESGCMNQHAEVGQNYDNDEWPIMAFFSSIWLFVHVLCLI